MGKKLLLLGFLLAGIVFATTFHTLPFDGSNAYDADEDFITSTDSIYAYCTWDEQYLYLSYTGAFLAGNDTVRTLTDMFWYIDTDPHPENPKSGNGTDSSGNYYTQIMPSFPWYFDTQSWTLPFYADYRIRADYADNDSVFGHLDIYDNDSSKWHSVSLDTTFANLDSINGYYEIRIPWDSLGNPPDIFILGHLVSGEWTGELYYDPDPKRDVKGTYGSWPWSSLEGGDGDKHEDGHFNHWFHFHIEPGISPDQENDPPVASQIDSQTVNEGDNFAIIDLNKYVFDDLSPDTLLTWTTQDEIDLTVTIYDSNQATVNTPNPDWNGTETITFIVTDEGGKSDTTYGTFTVLGDNQPPVAVNDTSSTIEDSSTTINVTHNDSDPDSAETVYLDRILETFNATVTIKNDSMVTYAPAENFFGRDSFSYVITDGNGGRDTAWVFVDVSAVNDAPEIVNLPELINMDTNSSTQLYMMDYASDVDTPDSLLTWSFDVSDPAISYEYNDTTDTLTIYSSGTSGDFYLFTTLTDDSGAFDQDTITIRVSEASAIVSGKGIPKAFVVFQNYPNPFNPSTTVTFGLSTTSDVDIEIFNLLGQVMDTRHLTRLSAGFHSIKINASDWPAGIYLYRIRAENQHIIKKMVFVK